MRVVGRALEAHCAHCSVRSPGRELPIVTVTLVNKYHWSNSRPRWPVPLRFTQTAGYCWRTLSEARSHLREGDVLVVWKLDRLGRSVKGLVDLVGELAQQGVQFRSLTDGIDTTTPNGRFFFHMMASLAQMERELIAERTKAGLDAARKRGRMVGRKRRMTPSKIASAKQLLSGGMAPRDVAQNLGVSIPTLYRWVPASSR
jgi:DNA invertase Pin-like site-specific DNA recombinase